jgi:glycosyltransferase involved in cell wall biosynthesis
LSSKAIYVPNYADIKRIRFKKDDSPGCPIKILYARRFTNQRGVWLILESARLLKEKGINFHLFMLSPEGQAISVDLIKSKIAELGLSEQVSIINNFDLDSIYDFYEQVDISVVPTLWSEGTSYSCIESIVAGVPVVTTTVGGLPNIIIPDFNGIIEPPIPERLAGAVIKLMESKKWRELHENCFRMRDAFSKRTWETKIKEWIDS